LDEILSLSVATKTIHVLQFSMNAKYLVALLTGLIITGVDELAPVLTKRMTKMLLARPGFPQRRQDQ
jgi:hypothetical protein